MSATAFLAAHCPPGVVALLRLFQKNDHGAYPVGGCVRDALMHTLPHDWDVAVTCPPDVTLSLCEAAGYRVIPTGLAHGTVTVLCGGMPVECTTCRADSTYSDGRHPDAVAFTNRLEDDLSRRDFTVNAMAARLGNGPDVSFDIVDLFGGSADLEARLIRCVGDPVTRFEEDALRILRAVRFAVKLGFEIEPNTRQALITTAPRLDLISRERVRAELEGILTSADPARGIRLLDELGLYPYVFPDCTAPADPDRLNRLPCDLSLRLAATLSHLPRKQADAALSSLRLSNRTSGEVKAYLDPLPCEAVATPLCARRIRQAFGTLAANRIRLEEDGEASEQLIALIKESEQNGDCVSIRELAVNGHDLVSAGIAGGAEVGVTLSRLLEYVIQHPEQNQADILMSHAREEQP